MHKKPLSMKYLEEAVSDEDDLDLPVDTSNAPSPRLNVSQTTPCHKSKTELVDKHPLTRTSSGSSSSSMELDNDSSSPRIVRYKKSPPRNMRRSSVHKIRDFVGKSDDASHIEATDGGGYYNTASALWHNRAKIFTNLKKQATDGVRSLTQSTSLDTGSNQGLLPKQIESSDTTQPEVSKAVPSSTSDSGLIKVETESITESKEDTEVSSFLQGLKDRVSDPLQILLKKREEEEEKKREEELFSMETPNKPRLRSFTSSSVGDNTTRTSRVRDLTRQSEPTWRPSSDLTSYKNSFAVSLSALLAGRGKNVDDDIVADDELINVDVAGDQKDPLDELNNNNIENTEDLMKIRDNDDNINIDPSDVGRGPSWEVVLLLTTLVYSYLIFPVSFPIQLITTSFICGSLFSAATLCIVAPQSRRPKPFLPTPINSKIPYNVPKSLYDPDQPIKGWMNEIFSYDPDTYHVSNTQTVFVTLDGATMRLQTPLKSIPRRSVYNEGNIPVTNVVHQRLYDITFAKVYLKPSGLVKKRVWSKKYPVCVEFTTEQENTNSTTNEDSPSPDTDMKTSYSSSDMNSVKQVECLYLFGRTDRQKEEWFYRIQRAINVTLSRHKKSLKLEQSKTAALLPKELNLEDEWGVIENHYEEETYVASSVCDVLRINDEPLRAFQDYFVHVSRLFPDAKSKKDATDKEARRHSHETTISNRSTDRSELVMKEPGLEVSWLNVVMGRVMFDFLRQQTWAKWLSIKIQKKLDKIKLPYFMDELKLTEMNLGCTVPLIHQISLPKLDSQGIWLDLEVTYSGSLQMTLKTKLVLTKLGKNEQELSTEKSRSEPSAITDSEAEDSAESSDEEDDESAVSRIVGQVQTAVSKLDGQQLIKDAIKHVGNEPTHSSAPSPLTSTQSGAPPSKKWVRIVDSIAKSKYFQKATENDYIRKKLETVSNTPMLLTVELLQLSGTLAVNIPPPPTDRIWYGFREPPLMLMKAHPKVGERVVKTTHVTDWIENKLQQEFLKVLVMPNMDDIPIPTMFNNRAPT